MQALGINAYLALLHGPMMLLDGVPIDADYILSLVVVDQIKVLQGGDHVLLLDGCPFADVAGEGGRD